MKTPVSKLRAARPYFLAALTVLALFVGRAMLEGAAAVRRSDERAAKGDVEGAIAHAMRATKWYVPFAKHPRDGYDRLRDIARRAELAGDGDTALIAWQAIRAGSRGTRSLWTPYEDRLHEADEHIALLLASKPPPGVDRGKPREQLVSEHRALLSRDDTPRPFSLIVMYLGLAAWLYGAFRATAAIDAWAEDKSVADRWGGGRARRAITGGLMALCGVVAFLLALARA
jgi:hypothetical protein